jgi:hypothetical protein
MKVNALDLGVGALMRKQEPFVAEPEPHPASRTQFGKLFKEAAQRAGDRLVGMKEKLPVALAPNQTDGQTAAPMSVSVTPHKSSKRYQSLQKLRRAPPCGRSFVFLVPAVRM